MPKSEHRSDGDGRDERDVRRRRHSHDRQSDGEEHERYRRSRGDRKDDEKSEHRSDGRRRHSHDRQYDGEEHERYRRSRGDRKDDEMSPQHRVLEDEEKESKRRRRERGPEEEGRVQKPQGKGEIRFDKDNSLPFEAQSSRFLLLDNIFDKSVERDKEFYLQIREEVHTKCALKGYVVHAIHVDRRSGALCLECDCTRSAIEARNIFEGKLFSDRIITCSFMKENDYNRRFGGNK